MKLLFSYTGPLIVDADGNYYSRTISDHVLARYFRIASNVTMLTRLKKVTDDNVIRRLMKIESQGFSVRQCPNLSSLTGMIFNKKQAKRIIEQAVKEADVVISRLPCFIGNLVINEAVRQRKPYLIELVGCPWDSMWNHSIKGKFIAPSAYYATKKRVKNAKYVVYVTNEFLQNRYPTDGNSVNCSNVMLESFDDGILEQRLKKIENNKNKKLVIGTTAAVNIRYKGQQYIIEALGKLKSLGIDHFEYQLVGGGDQTYLRAVADKFGVTDRVKFLGAMPHKEVFNWLDTIDIYVQPSRQEGLPRALIEAMSRGLPAFGARTAGIPELLDSDMLFSNTSRNIQEICTILQNMKPEKMKQQAIRNYSEAKKYDKEVIEERRNKFFHDFIQNNRNRIL